MAKTILIVDDSPSVLAILEDMLDGLGYSATAVSNGKQACELLETNRYDLIITDLTMPVMDGITFAQTAKQMPNSPHIANQTGDQGKPFDIVCFNSGINRYQIFILRTERPLWLG